MSIASVSTCRICGQSFTGPSSLLIGSTGKPIKTVPETLPERVLLGMMRTPQPPGVEYIRGDGSVSYCDFVLCPCGDELWDQKQRLEHWLQGHFDKPVYATKQEMIDRAIFRQPLLGQDDAPHPVEPAPSDEATVGGEAKI